MCGLTGFWSPGASMPPEQLERIIKRMSDTLVHRGPDDSGSWTDDEAGIAFGFRRLAIIDLSPAGHQPMCSSDGRYVIVFNGEIYNYRELRAELGACGKEFRGGSDTEVILEAFSQWGVRATVERLIGMFAIALWDRKARELHLIRDRLGIKPLYWAKFGSLFIFGSELRALLAHPSSRREIDHNAIAAYLRFAYVPAPFTPFRGVHKLEPGTILTLSAGGATHVDPFWQLSDVVQSGHAEPLRLSDGDAAEELHALLRDAIARRMIADVPLGAFLSGGVDSSSVVALMQATSARPIRTFTIGFSEADYNEAHYAKAVAQHLGTDHTELYVSPQSALEIVPHMADHYDEPLGDVSQIPTLLLSKLTRDHVTVALSGDGGDEVFSGYEHYRRASTIWRQIKRLPLPARSIVGSAMRTLPLGAWDSLLSAIPGATEIKQAGHKVHKLSRLIDSASPDQLFCNLVSLWDDPERVATQATHEARAKFFDRSTPGIVPDFLQRMRYIDTLTYLPDDILMKVDRASMSVGLEARVPLLDHRIIAFSWRLPANMLTRHGVSKWLLRQVLHRYVPAALIERPKAGFTIPIDAWLRGPLRDWAEDLLSERRLNEGGLLDSQCVRTRWTDFINGRRNWHYSLWSALMLQQWQRRWADAQNVV